MEVASGNVVQGTCGWMDEGLVRCGRFYPSWVKSTEDRLKYYGTRFACVECDSSSLAIPEPRKVERWCECVPAGFRFHFKAFGMFTKKVRCAFVQLSLFTTACHLKMSLLAVGSWDWDSIISPCSTIQCICRLLHLTICT